MKLVDHPEGGYRFLPGIAPYSCGVVAKPGFEIAHVTFSSPPPYRAGFERIARFLAESDRPKAALCGVELRSPVPYSFAGFSDFNAEYASILKQWGLFVDGVNPVARTNVAPMISPPKEPVLYGFSFARPAEDGVPLTGVVAGGGELPEGLLQADAIVARGDVSPAGLREKAQFVLQLMERRLLGLGLTWSSVSQVDIYTAHRLHQVLSEVILPGIGEAAIHGVHWHFSRPPIAEIEFEMDLRAVVSELRV